MEEVIAIIRSSRAKLTKEKLAQNGFIAYTEGRVSGRGRQKGLRYSNADGLEEFGGIPFLPKRMLTLFVNNEDLDQLISILSEANKTGEIGDGKIFICPVEDVIRIRTDERNSVALMRG